MEKFAAKAKERRIKTETNQVSAKEGGVVTLDDGATLQVLPESTTLKKELSMSVLSTDVVEMCAKHDCIHYS
jgi:hypothetical protein